MAQANGTNGNGTNGANGHNGHALTSTNGHAVTVKPLPDKWDEAKIAQTLDLMSEGQSCVKACEASGLKRSTFLSWVLDNTAGLGDRYARARDLQIRAMESDILTAADDADEDPNRSRLKVDARKWIMSKVAPRTYGDAPPPVVSVTNMQFIVDPFRDHRELRNEAEPIDAETG